MVAGDAFRDWGKVPSREGTKDVKKVWDLSRETGMALGTSWVMAFFWGQLASLPLSFLWLILETYLPAYHSSVSSIAAHQDFCLPWPPPEPYLSFFKQLFYHSLYKNIQLQLFRPFLIVRQLNMMMGVGRGNREKKNPSHALPFPRFSPISQAQHGYYGWVFGKNRPCSWITCISGEHAEALLGGSQ